MTWSNRAAHAGSQPGNQTFFWFILHHPGVIFIRVRFSKRRHRPSLQFEIQNLQFYNHQLLWLPLYFTKCNTFGLEHIFMGWLEWIIMVRCSFIKGENSLEEPIHTNRQHEDNGLKYKEKLPYEFKESKEVTPKLHILENMMQSIERIK